MSDYGDAEKYGITLTDEEKYAIAMGWSTLSDIVAARGEDASGGRDSIYIPKQGVENGKNPFGSGQIPDIIDQNPGSYKAGGTVTTGGNTGGGYGSGMSADELLRNMAVKYMNGGMDTSFDTFATARTAGIPRQFSQQASAQAAQLANNGLSGSGLASRAQRNNRLDENDAWNAGMSQARGDYQQNVIGNRQKAMDMLAKTSDTKAQREAAAAFERATRKNEKATEKTGAQNAYEIIGGIRNGISGDNGVF